MVDMGWQHFWKITFLCFFLLRPHFYSKNKRNAYTGSWVKYRYHTVHDNYAIHKFKLKDRYTLISALMLYF